MKHVLLLSCLSLALGSLSSGQDEGFEPLFNGKDLYGWVVVNTAPSTWKFNDEGLLICSGKPIGEIRTERMYQNFILEIEWRHMVPKGNAGIFVWADDITARGTPFHRSIEVQVLENAYGNNESHTTHGDIFPIHGATMTPVNGRGGSRAFPTENRSNPSPEWNHYRVECQDGNISLAVNGKVVTRGRDCNPRKGYLCLESEGGVVHYRNARIKVLPDTPIEPEQIAIANRGYRTLYTGVDLSGWESAKGWASNDWVLKNEKDAEPLKTEESFSGNLGFVIDLRLGEETGTPEVWLGDKKLLVIDDSVAPLLENTGRWNRFEAEVEGGKVRWRINEKAGPEMTVEEGIAGPLALHPDGPADWANLFVRKLQSSAP